MGIMRDFECLQGLEMGKWYRLGYTRFQLAFEQQVGLPCLIGENEQILIAPNGRLLSMATDVSDHWTGELCLSQKTVADLGRIKDDRPNDRFVLRYYDGCIDGPLCAICGRDIEGVFNAPMLAIDGTHELVCVPCGMDYVPEMVGAAMNWHVMGYHLVNAMSEDDIPF